MDILVKLFFTFAVIFVWPDNRIVQSDGTDADVQADSGGGPAATVETSSVTSPTYVHNSVNTDVETGISTNDDFGISNGTTEAPDYIGKCPSNVECHKLGAECIQCDLEHHLNCVYGSIMKTMCTVKPDIQCLGPPSFNTTFQCRYCYQTVEEDHSCSAPSTTCKVVTAPRERYKMNCTAKSHVLCLGKRDFHKMKTCNWTSGKRWSTALILSITVGGFGVDRFYLGLWKEGIGKLFSFGGLGAWTLVDVVLVATGYVGPEDGSLYIF